MSTVVAAATHLRSTDRPEARRSGKGVITVWTECGQHVAAVLVDNEQATCAECRRIDRERAWGVSDAEKQRRELAASIANQARAIADGRVIGPQHAAVRRLAANVEVLAAWTPDDRAGSVTA